MASACVSYSPAGKMDISALSKQNLTNMKYHQLLKLSNKYKVTKRWAKKDDLISSLLSLKNQVLKAEGNNENEETEWTDGDKMFNVLNPLPSNNSDTSSRATFIVDKLDNPRATYNLSDPRNISLPDSSQTDVTLNRLTFNIPKGTVPHKREVDSKVKMLTVPYSRQTVRSIGRQSSIKQSPLKLSNKSIVIKKSKNNMSPMKTTKITTSKTGKTPLPSKPQSRFILSDEANKPKRPTIISSSSNKEKENSEKIFNRRKSKSDNPELRRKSSIKCVAEFRTPPANNAGGKCSQQKKQNPRELSGVKPFTGAKIPDFAKIHQRNFDKMDSLDEYISKKADRVKKLFGTPKVVKPVVDKIAQKAMTCHQGKNGETGNVEIKLKHDNTRNLLNRNHPLRTQTDVKDKNRSHIHGIRTNRRFELQMKFRNM